MKKKYSLNFTLKYSLIVVLYFSSSFCLFAQVDLQKGLIACFPFSGNANDATGNGNNGTVTNGPVLVNDRFNNPNCAYEFDGVDDYISISPTNFKNPNYTYSLWANVKVLPSTGSNIAVWSIGNTDFPGAGDQFIMLGANYVNSVQSGWYAGGYNTVGGTTLKAVGSLPTINTWYHLAVTRDNSFVKFYVNGQLIGSVSTGGSAPRYGGTDGAVEAGIGRRAPTLGGQYFKGIIDDFSMYNRALSDVEITAIYNNSNCLTLPLPTAQSASRCGTGSLTLTATGGNQYRWYDAQIGGNLLFTGDTYTTPLLNYSQIYYVSNFNGSVESERKAVSATILPVPDLPLVNNISRCGYGSVTLQASGGTSYRWYSDINSNNPISTESFFITPSLSASSVYYVSNFEGTCESAKQPVQITIFPLPPIPVIESNGPTSFCLGEDVILSAPAGFSGYFWSNGANTRTIVVSQAGSYTVKVKDGNGCESAASEPLVINVANNIEPDIKIDIKENTICAESAITFVAKPINEGINPLYQWRVNGVNQGEPGNTPEFVYVFQNAEQIYQAEISVEMTSSFTCAIPKKVKAERIINIQPKIFPQVSIHAIGDTFCSKDEIFLSAQALKGGLSPLYQWKINQIDKGLPTASPEFKLDTVNYTSHPIQIKVSVVLFSNLPCSIPDTASKWITINPSPDVVCLFPDVVESKSRNIYQVKVSNGYLPYTFTWDFSNEDIFKSQTDTLSYTFEKSGNYLITVNITDGQGCETTCNKFVKVKPIINIPPNVFTPNGDKYNERFTIDYEGEERFEMIIYNRWGKPITSIYDGKQGWDGAGCSTGLYFYTIKVEDKEFKGWIHLLR